MSSSAYFGTGPANPFRPDGDLSKEADGIVSAVKNGTLNEVCPAVALVSLSSFTLVSSRCLHHAIRLTKRTSGPPKTLAATGPAATGPAAGRWVLCKLK